jgi:hypothetical protein
MQPKPWRDQVAAFNTANPPENDRPYKPSRADRVERARHWIALAEKSMTSGTLKHAARCLIDARQALIDE